MNIVRKLVTAVVATTAMSAAVVIPPTAAHAADTDLGRAVRNIAYGQLTDDNAEVRKRLSEKGTNCNFYSGFWADSRNAAYDGSSASSCGVSSKGYEWRKGKKVWVSVTWRSRSWCADFAKYAFYWGHAKIGGLTAKSGSFKTYGVKNGTWHAKGSYIPRMGDAVSYDTDHDGVINHVGIVTSSYTSNRDGTFNSVEGNYTNKVSRVTNTSNRDRDIVGYTSPAPR